MQSRTIARVATGKRLSLIDCANFLSWLFFGIFLAFSCQAQNETIPNPSAAEKAILARYNSYNDYIHLIESNESNGFFKFLADNTGKTVFVDSAILRYSPAPAGVTDKERHRIPPTDRFENPSINKCWGDELNKDGLLESGEDGFPLPENQSDIMSGCSTRIKFEFIHGDYGNDNIKPTFGFDKNEVFFVGFFEVTKEKLKSGKTLYRLKEVLQPQDTTEVFYKHATKKERPFRKLWIDSYQSNKGMAK